MSGVVLIVLLFVTFEYSEYIPSYTLSCRTVNFEVPPESDQLINTNSRGYREILKDKSSDIYCVLSVSKENKNEHFVTVELVTGDPRTSSGQLMERETPTLNQDTLEESANRAKELYESFWSSDKYGTLSFKTIDSKYLN